ncbi:ATP-binding cassette domain-containing protein [Allohahella marinimesophila]|uniref:ATP-binding cassette domain-containing protein n=1 Tax=Allohahella marinimesophila TaxID=1054972 RepID=A0ABP7NN61_9GAMM
MKAHELHLQQVRLCLQDKLLLALDASLAGGEVLTIMGPSGSGKSTLLAHVAGFLPPAFRASGKVMLDDEDITSVSAERSGVGLLFQDPLLFPHLSVAGNLRFGLVPGHPKPQMRVEQALAEIGLSGFGSRDPETLSGGQRARVSLMRLLLSEPRAVLLDEPFSKLDRSLRAEMRQLVFEHLTSRGLPTILVTHDHEDAEAARGRVIELF